MMKPTILQLLRHQLSRVKCFFLGHKIEWFAQEQDEGPYADCVCCGNPGAHTWQSALISFTRAAQRGFRPQAATAYDELPF